MAWLLEHASPPMQYRALVEVARVDAATAARAAGLPYAWAPAVRIAVAQRSDGTWPGLMLGVPGTGTDGVSGLGTVPAVHRLLEYGWHRESPPMLQARRTLFRLLAEDEDPSLLFEFSGTDAKDPDLARRARGILREAAAAALAHAGYENDPRLRGAARRILERIAIFLKSPLAEKPWVRLGNRHVLSPDASPPSFHALFMLAHMPLFRSEHHDSMDRICRYLANAMPRQEIVQQVGQNIVPQSHLVLGDMLPHRNAADADIPWALVWLELMARLGFLRKHEPWTRLLDRFLDDRDSRGAWHPHKGASTPHSTNPLVWPFFPLEQHTAGEEKWTDVTFRLGLIARLSGRPIELT